MAEEKKTNLEVVAAEINESEDRELTPETSPKFDTSANKEVIRLPFETCKRLFWSNADPPKKPKSGFYFWYPPGQSSYEKKLVFKVDCAVMSYVCLSYFVRYLDAQNVASAYVSGMEEDLKLSGYDYAVLTTGFNAAYSIIGPLSTTYITRFKVHHVLPALEILWGLMCLLIYRAKDFKTILALRLVQGLCEGAAWPAIHYILGSWYTQQELAKRVSIFTASGSLGTLFSGLIQSALKATMDGKAGLAGWRWLFIIDAVVTFPIAFYGFFVFPDVPNNATPRFFLKEDDIQFCRDRLKINGKHRVDRLDRTFFSRVFKSYNWYLFVTVWTVWTFQISSGDYFGIVLGDLGYDVYDRNNIPTITKGVAIVSCILSGFIIDIRGKRWEVAIVATLVWVMGNAIVFAFYVPRGLLIFGYICGAMSSVTSPLIVGWCNELSKEDDQLRAFTIGSLNFVAGLISIPWGIFLWNTDYGPRFFAGSLGGLLCAILLVALMLVILQFDRYQNRKREYIAKNHSQDSQVIEDEESKTAI